MADGLMNTQQQKTELLESYISTPNRSKLGITCHALEQLVKQGIRHT